MTALRRLLKMKSHRPPLKEVRHQRRDRADGGVHGRIDTMAGRARQGTGRLSPDAALTEAGCLSYPASLAYFEKGRASSGRSLVLEQPKI